MARFKTLISASNKYGLFQTKQEWQLFPFLICGFAPSLEALGIEVLFER